MSAKSKLKTELDFLSSLEGGEIVTQMTLSKRIGVAVGLINALLRRATLKGFVKVRAAPYKRYAYYLTPRGFAEKSRLVAEYLEVSLEFFREARREYEDLFTRARGRGLRRIVLVGSGELAEIAVLAGHAAGIDLVAILDSETNRERLFGLPVVRSTTDFSDVDAFVVTESRAPQAAYDRLRAALPEQQVLAPPLLKITPDLEEWQPMEATP
jgi:hypothetical protein